MYIHPMFVGRVGLGLAVAASLFSDPSPPDGPADPPSCPLVWDCASASYPEYCVNPLGLDLNTTQIIFDIIRLCDRVRNTSDWRLNSKRLPTLAGLCAVSGRSPSQWTGYPGMQVWQRLTSWKLPLLQLLFLTPLPPLGFTVLWLVLVRLVGNPIGSLQHLILKLDDCQTRVRAWQEVLGSGGALWCIPALPEHHAWTITPFREKETERWQFQLPEQLNGKHYIENTWVRFQRYERLVKTFTLIVVSLDEYGWAVGSEVQDEIKGVLKLVENSADILPEFIDICVNTAEALAADRSTRALPIVTAQLVFICAILSPFVNILLGGPEAAGAFLNIEAYSIGFSLMFLWILSTTPLSAVIGVTQSEDRIPRILNRFRAELQQLQIKICYQNPLRKLHEAKCSADLHARSESPWCNCPPGSNLSSTRFKPLEPSCKALEKLIKAIPLLPTTENEAPPSDAPSDPSFDSLDVKRLHNGVIASWQIERHEALSSGVRNKDLRSNSAIRFSGAAALSIVTFGTGIGCLQCYFVPPHGFEPRHIAILLIWFLWIASWALDAVIPRKTVRQVFWSHLIKDSIATSLSVLGVILTQIGFLNTPNSYTLFGKEGAPFSQFPEVADEIYHNFKTKYAAILFSTIICYQMFFPGVIICKYWDAMRVFLQQDNGQSHSTWFQKKFRFTRWSGTLLHTDGSETHLMAPNGNAAGSSGDHEEFEMEPIQGPQIARHIRPESQATPIDDLQAAALLALSWVDLYSHGK